MFDSSFFFIFCSLENETTIQFAITTTFCRYPWLLEQLLTVWFVGMCARMNQAVSDASKYLRTPTIMAQTAFVPTLYPWRFQMQFVFLWLFHGFSPWIFSENPVTAIAAARIAATATAKVPRPAVGGDDPGITHHPTERGFYHRDSPILSSYYGDWIPICYSIYLSIYFIVLWSFRMERSTNKY